MGEGKDFEDGSLRISVSSLTRHVSSGFGCLQVNSPCGEQQKRITKSEMHRLSGFSFIYIQMQITVKTLADAPEANSRSGSEIGLLLINSIAHWFNYLMLILTQSCNVNIAEVSKRKINKQHLHLLRDGCLVLAVCTALLQCALYLQVSEDTQSRGAGRAGEWRRETVTAFLSCWKHKHNSANS